MPEYIIHHKIDTLLQLWEPFDFREFRFRPCPIDVERGRHDGWVAEKNVVADTFEEAFRAFSDELYRLVDRIAFIGQCHTTVELEAFVILKPGDDRFFYRHSSKRGPVPLHFGGEEIESLAALEGYEETGDVFRYLREATNATTFYTMLVMLVSALEGMAGEAPKNGYRRVDHQYIADVILRDEELCGRLFRGGRGIRNQILHGGFVDDHLHGATNYNQTVYDAIIDYFNEHHGAKIDKNAKARPRTIIGNYDLWSGWCRWVSREIDFSLELLNQRFDPDQAHAYVEFVDQPEGF